MSFGVDAEIVPAYTYTASASVVAHVGATIVLVDSQKDNVEMDYDKLANAITERTKVIVPVDIAGICADVDKVREIVNRPEILAKFHPANDIQKLLGRIAISNDCAHSCGSPVPFIEGESWNEFIYRLSQLFSLHGQNKDALAKTKLGAWEYDIIGPWYKCNMTDIMAALGLVQFERYPSMLEKRHEMVSLYNAGIDSLNAGIDAAHQVKYLNHRAPDHCSSHHLYLVRLQGRTREEANKVIEQMAERGIATNVHYKPLPMMTAYKAHGFDIADFPNAYHLFENEITLPLNTKMSMEDAEYVIENFVEIVRGL